MADVTITHRIDLAVSFVDNISGAPARGHVLLSRNGAIVRYLMSSDGIALFSDVGREDFVLGINVSGYEYEELQVEYANLDEGFPLIEVSLIPQDTLGDVYTTIDGTLSGLIAADAVCVERTVWSVLSVDQRKRLLTVESQYKREIGGKSYGIIAKDNESYAPIAIIKKISYGIYKIDSVPTEDILGLRLAYRVAGRVRDGTCLLRLPHRSGNANWIIRAETESGNTFRTFDPSEAELSTAGRRIGISDIMSRAAPTAKNTDKHDAEMKGG
ncbi:MAG: hypothetical protein LBQ21_00640 [Clostridiales Family XIII bacterium]|jgi:hypothetical protein|nr:hypothetical protein [Clostridiales Family XIII bacterium]